MTAPPRWGAPVELPLDRLAPHPDNANRMPAELFDKLVDHLRRDDRYPPLIVRPVPQPTPAQRDDSKPGQASLAGPTHQLLDGHHRARALQQLGRTSAHCVIWDVDDTQALVLLATLNRLQGDDDPRKRSDLVAKLAEQIDVPDLADRLPEDAERLRLLLRVRLAPPPPAPPKLADDLPEPVYFFLARPDKKRLEDRLRQLGPTREAALMRLLDVPA
ncbi:MAG: ParB/RepB/Spo0J family partition protein [Planctomycetota bacterium]